MTVVCIFFGKTQVITGQSDVTYKDTAHLHCVAQALVLEAAPQVYCMLKLARLQTIRVEHMHAAPCIYQVVPKVVNNRMSVSCET